MPVGVAKRADEDTPSSQPLSPAEPASVRTLCVDVGHERGANYREIVRLIYMVVCTYVCECAHAVCGRTAYIERGAMSCVKLDLQSRWQPIT
jgi:hypothetical protein